MENIFNDNIELQSEKSSPQTLLPSEYWISPDAITIELNALDNPQYLQVSLLAESVILAYRVDVIGYDASYNFRRWVLQAYNNFFDRTDRAYVYAQLDKEGSNALIIYSYEPLLLTGTVTDNAGNTKEVYNVYLATISPSSSGSGELVPRYWEDPFDTGRLSTDQYKEEETKGEWAKMFHLNKVTDLIEPLKDFAFATIYKLYIGVRKILIIDVQTSSEDDIYLDNRDDVLPTTKQVKDSTERKFLRKDMPDATKYLLSLFGGAIFGKDGFAAGLTGFGAKIDDRGYGEMRGLTLWEWLQVPEIRFNRIEVYLGIKWRTPGGGIIETCTPDQDSEGNELTTGICMLKLEEGELGAVSLDDIALGIFHFGNEKDATEDSDDGQGNFSFAGFATSYFRITEVIGDDHKKFRYSLRPGYTIHPQPQMHFSCYGNFTNEYRQRTVYETREYTRMLWKQNTWTFGPQNIAMQFGDLTNLNVFGLNMSGYSMYLNSVYFTGVVSQVKPDGTPIMTANDRGAWQNDTKYDYYDRVSHKGCIWLCVNEDGTNTEPSDENTNWLKQVDKGETGQDGTSFKILGSKNDESELPQSGNSIGDAYLINGDLWVWTAENIWKNVGNIQGPAGQSVKPLGNWYSGLFVPHLGVVRMGTATFMCTNEKGTYNPPMWIWTDKDTNRYIFDEGGYVLTGEYNGIDYLIIAENGTNAVSIIKVDVEYAITTSNTVAPESGWQTLAPPWENGKYIWSRSVTYYSDGNKTMTEAACISGGKGIKSIVEYYYRSTSATELIGGEWTTICPEWINGTYIWTKSVIEYTDGTTDEEGEMNSTGAQGEGFTNLGKWYTGLLVSKMGVVTMGGSSWVATIATRNPPLWCWTDKDGNRFVYNDSTYVLNGEQNAEEYDLMAEKGEDGKDGIDGEDGKDGMDGLPGKDGTDYEYIYKRTTTYSRPSTPTSEQENDYVPSDWTDNPQGVSMTYMYEWVCKRNKQNGKWSDFSTPALWAKYGEQGDQGALPRYRGVYKSSESYIYGMEDGILIRDIVVLDSTIYQVATRGDIIQGIAPPNSRWQEASKFDFVAMDTALIDNANIGGFIFRRSGWLPDGSPYGELRSQNNGTDGNPVLQMFTKTGQFICQNVDIKGKVKATSGLFENVTVKNISSPNNAFKIDADGNVQITGKFQTAASGNRVVIDPSNNTLSFITSGGVANCTISFGTYGGYSTANIFLRSSSGSTIYDSASIAPHEIRLSDKMVSGSVKLNCNELSIVGNDKTAIFGADEISLTVGGTKYTGLTGKFQIGEYLGKPEYAYFYNGLFYKKGS